MGFFSWMTQDTNESIANTYSCREPFTVYMYDNKGNRWEEQEYEGYGEFGGKDFYELLAEMNGKTTRDEGIDIAFGKEPYLSPNLVESPDWEWNESIPEGCPEQGYFYDDESEDDEEEE